MKTERSFPAFTVTKKAELSLKAGHPWVYAEEIVSEKGSYENGGIADVFSEKGTYLGSGLISNTSKIRVRVLAANANETFSDTFWKRRVRYAVDYRLAVMGEDFSACRLIFGEADGIPGLTVDKFGSILVSEVLSYGIEKRKDIIYRALYECLTAAGYPVDGIYERNEAAIRDLEGLEKGKGWYEGIPHTDATTVGITENGVKYTVDFVNGQKTGYFLDQKYNRLAVSRVAKGRKVLDCFTHTGSFALNCVRGGASHVTAVDISPLAIETAKANAMLNGATESMDFVTADVFDLLTGLDSSGRHDYDLIILDPPAFTKSRKTTATAYKGYKEINRRAMKLLPRGGYLATASCSHFMDESMFVKMLSEAALDTNVTLRLVEERRQAPDHPILLNVPETSYLKFYIFQII